MVTELNNVWLLSNVKYNVERDELTLYSVNDNVKLTFNIASKIELITNGKNKGSIEILECFDNINSIINGTDKIFVFDKVKHNKGTVISCIFEIVNI